MINEAAKILNEMEIVCPEALQNVRAEGGSSLDPYRQTIEDRLGAVSDQVWSSACELAGKRRGYR